MLKCRWQLLTFTDCHCVCVVLCRWTAGHIEHRYLERTLRPWAIPRPRLSQGRLTISFDGCRFAVALVSRGSKGCTLFLLSRRPKSRRFCRCRGRPHVLSPQYGTVTRLHSVNSSGGPIIILRPGCGEDAGKSSKVGTPKRLWSHRYQNSSEETTQNSSPDSVHHEKSCGKGRSHIGVGGETFCSCGCSTWRETYRRSGTYTLAAYANEVYRQW